MSEELYVYGVVPAAEAAELPAINGIDGRVRTVTAGELAALVSSLAPDHVPGTREDIETHRDVLNLAIKVTAVVPMRFGTVMGGEEVVRGQLLGEQADELAALLGKLEGQVQMTVRAYYAGDALLATAIASDEEIERRSAELRDRPELETREQRVELGELVAGAIDERRAADEQALLDRLAPFATELRVDPPAGDRVALSAHLLVPRERRAELDALVGELGRVLGGVLAIRYIGPLPAYSFADVELDAAES